MSSASVTKRDWSDDNERTSGRNVVAAIGIDRYQYWPQLSNAVNDARGVLASFERLGFEQAADPLLDQDATGEAIQRLIADDLGRLGPHDNLVLFYAGHGSTRTHRVGDQEVKNGYLIPVDAPNERATWIDLDGSLRTLGLAGPKHILVILGTCSSGIALPPTMGWRSSHEWPRTPSARLQARRSRQIITSALDVERAFDSGPIAGHSLFTSCLLKALTGEIERLQGHEISSSELGWHLRERVAEYTLGRQTPDFSTFYCDDLGELMIPIGARSGPSAIVNPTAAIPTSPEVTLATEPSPHRDRPPLRRPLDWLRKRRPMAALAKKILEDWRDPHPVLRVAQQLVRRTSQQAYEVSLDEIEQISRISDRRQSLRIAEYLASERVGLLVTQFKLERSGRLENLPDEAVHIALSTGILRHPQSGEIIDDWPGRVSCSYRTSTEFHLRRA